MYDKCLFYQSALKKGFRVEIARKLACHPKSPFVCRPCLNAVLAGK